MYPLPLSWLPLPTLSLLSHTHTHTLFRFAVYRATYGQSRIELQLAEKSQDSGKILAAIAASLGFSFIIFKLLQTRGTCDRGMCHGMRDREGRVAIER